MTKKRKKKDNRRIYILNGVIIIVLIIIILAFIKTCQNYKLKPVPTGNIDIFDLKCTSKTCKECKICPTSPGTKKPSNTKPVIKEEEKNPEEDIEGLNVFDDKITWTTNSELRIFTNPAYEFKEILTPGSSNSYVFRVRNNNDFNVKYNISVLETNENNINMKYKLKKGTIYLKGDKNNWVNYNELQLNSIYLASRNYDEYTLEWKWIESSNDTAIGLTDNAKYKLNIEIIGAEI